MPVHRASHWMGALAVGLAVLLAHAPASTAGETVFGYVYTTDLVPKGKAEWEQWITDRRGQAYQRFDDIKLRTEYEYGVTDNLQLGGYLNYSYELARANSVRHLTEGLDIRRNHDARNRYRGTRLDGFSAELIWRVLSSLKDPVGLAFYLEPQWGLRGRGLEFRTIVQKNLLDNRLVLAGNLMIEAQKEGSSNLIDPGRPAQMPDSRRKKATYAEVDLGASYRFASNWSAGLELRNHNEFDGYSLAHRQQNRSAYFLGPSLHYGGKRWFFTLSALRQIHATTYTRDQAHQMRGGMLVGDEHTRWDSLRLKFGYSFE